ncbi:unnamed protein product [Pedinophyceae sp. YPF-701]|nr:unnamed protein product [Pedinophyceae sp. YPF-701]
MAQVNQVLDRELCCEVAEDFDAIVLEAEDSAASAKKDVEFLSEEDLENLVARPPVVTVMGHVDHGKTSLLDYIRKSRVADGEAGGITQSIGAYNVRVEGDNDSAGEICFLDTPGHEAFSAMRARGAKVTDIAIVIVAADDGIKPQTTEAISHAQAAGVPIVVAVNKIDKDGADVERTKAGLAEVGLLCEEWGGDVPVIPVSAKKGTGVTELLETLLLVAEVQELVANPKRNASGTVIEAQMDQKRGAAASILVQAGTLKVGDVVVCGSAFGRVRAMVNDRGATVEEAGPSTAVQMFGLNAVPTAGTVFQVYEDESAARSAAGEAGATERTERLASQMGESMVTASTLVSVDGIDVDDMLQRINIILKADASGTVEAIKGALGNLPQDRVSLRYLLAGAGEVTESDIDLAAASQGLVVAFNVTPSESVTSRAKQQNVEIRTYRIIYDLIDDVRGMMEGHLAPVMERMDIGKAEVKAVFGGGKAGKVAGVEVVDGALRKGAFAAVKRGRKNYAVEKAAVLSIRRFTELVDEVEAGTECGVGLEGFKDFQEGDVIECYELVRKRRTLEEASEARVADRDSAREKQKEIAEAASS